jgi:hypothetical protein
MKRSIQSFKVKCECNIQHNYFYVFDWGLGDCIYVVSLGGVITHRPTFCQPDN